MTIYTCPLGDSQGKSLMDSQIKGSEKSPGKDTYVSVFTYHFPNVLALGILATNVPFVLKLWSGPNE